MHGRLAAILLALSIPTFTACDEAEPEPEVEHLRAGFWDGVICLGSNQTRCYAHRPAADELWSPVLSDCNLDTRVEIHGWVETDDGYTAACDLGGEPQTFPFVRCFYRTANTVVCFGGDDGWYTEVGPACDKGDYTSSTWMPTSCDIDKQIGLHDYDHVFVSPTTATGRAFDGPDRFGVVPDCKLAGGGAPAGPGGC